MACVFYTIHRWKYSKKSNPGTILKCNWKLLYKMEFYIALPCITYFEAYDFCKGLVLKNMKTIVAIRTLIKEDKKISKDRATRKIPKKHILLFGHGSFLASKICLWWAAIWKRQKLLSKRWKWRRWKAPDKFPWPLDNSGPKFSADNNDATNDATIQKYLWQICEQKERKEPKGYYQAAQNE